MITTCPSKPTVLAIASAMAMSFFIVPSIFAAAPDGAGPWADSVVSASQGLRKDGSAVPAARSDASSALGVAEDDTVDEHFYSLGFGGKIVLKFDKAQSGGVVVVESTNPNYPVEKATVEVSENGSNWIAAGTVSQDGEVSIPQQTCAKYVRLTDTSNPADFNDGTADGYDVDGVKLTGTACNPRENGGDTTVIIKQDSTCEVTQATKTNVVNIQSSTAATGGNKIKKTTSTSNSVTTGKAKSKNKATVTGGSNIAINPCGSCCDTSNTCAQ